MNWQTTILGYILETEKHSCLVWDNRKWQIRNTETWKVVAVGENLRSLDHCKEEVEKVLEELEG